MSRLQLSWVKSELSPKQRMLGKEAVEGAFCLGYALNCGLAADKQQLELMEMKQMSRALPQIRIRLRQRIANCTTRKGGVGESTTSSATQNLQNSFMQMKWLLWRRLLSMHTRGNAKRRQEREKDRWERGREREWGREKGKEKKPSNEWNLSRLFSSFCATIKQFTYIFEYSNIFLTNYAEGITERKSGKKGEGILPMGSGCCPSSFALMNLKPVCLRVMWEMNT